MPHTLRPDVLAAAALGGTSVASHNGHRWEEFRIALIGGYRC
jgi:hypothetical protein